MRALVLLVVLTSACSGSSTPTARPAATASPSPVASPRPAATGDVDGDGRTDVITVSAHAVEVRLSHGGTATARLVDPGTPQPVLSGVADVDGDHRYEVFVETARGPSASFVQMYRYDGKRLAEVTSGGKQIRLGIGGTVTHGEGFSCPGAGVVVVRRAESYNGTGYTLRTRTYALTGSVLVLRKETTVTAPSFDDPRVAVAFQVDCGSVGEATPGAD